TLVTREAEPLWLFGDAAAGAVRELLAARGIALRTGERATAYRVGELELEGSPPLAVDHAIALPVLEGPRIPGPPHDGAGFVPTDAHGRVVGVELSTPPAMPPPSLSSRAASRPSGRTRRLRRSPRSPACRSSPGPSAR